MEDLCFRSSDGRNWVSLFTGTRSVECEIGNMLCAPSIMALWVFLGVIWEKVLFCRLSCSDSWSHAISDSHLRWPPTHGHSSSRFISWGGVITWSRLIHIPVGLRSGIDPCLECRGGQTDISVWTANHWESRKYEETSGSDSLSSCNSRSQKDDSACHEGEGCVKKSKPKE